MLQQIDLTKEMPKDKYKERMEKMMPELSALQRECRELGIPVMIVFEGFGAAGKGVQINHLIESMDPRGFSVYAVSKETQEEKMRPFLWRFWIKTPERGRIAVFDTSWYRKVQKERFEKKMDVEELLECYEDINSFERQLSDDGTVIIKFFLCIDKKEQKNRFEKLLESKSSAWRVSEDDKKRNKEFARYREINDEMIQKTDTACAPWTIVEATDRRFATVKIYSAVIKRLTEAVESAKRTAQEKPLRDSLLNLGQDVLRTSQLNNVDLSVTCEKEEYKHELKRLQERLGELHGELYRRRIPVVLGFEGWDAGGKGGAIKRLTQALDPRGYQVNPTASPNDIEKKHHYLWRFWNNMPKAGHVAIFDRTWYGRVMVERIEGFCTTQEWQRAYREINDMERQLVNAGAVVLKFWMQIDKDEQEKRFQERMQNPQKQWKITDEDWRNREKWDAYEVAVDEMLVRTSTSRAPWIIVEGNSKYYARLKVLRIVIEAIEERLKQE